MIEFLDSCRDALFILDSNKIIIHANLQAEKLLDLKKHEIIGGTLCNKFTPCQDKRNLDLFEKAETTREFMFWETYCDKTNAWLELGSYPLSNGDVAVSIRDITDRKLAENALRQSETKAMELVKELREADAHKNDFISTLSHELRNPLAVIYMGLSLLDSVEPGSPKDLRTREMIKRQTTQLIGLVNDLLDVSNIKENKIQLNMGKVEICQIAGDILKECSSLFGEKGVTLEHEWSDDSICVNGDGLRIKQVLINLLLNALKFTPGGGVVKISVLKDIIKNDVCVTVTDTGIGISREMELSMFEPFVMANNSFIRDTCGLGLGLSIIKGIMDLHGGTVEVNSKGLNCGTEFTVRFPGA